MATPNFTEHGVPGDAEPHPGEEPDEPTLVNSHDEEKGIGNDA